MSFTYSPTQLANIQYQKDLVKKDEEIAELKAKMNLTPCLYAVQYEKDLVKKDEEIALLKAKEKSNTGWLKLTQDNAELKAENEKLKEQMSAMVKEVKVGEDVKVGEGDVGWEKY